MNARDVRATFEEPIPLDGLRRIRAPLLAVHGGASPAVTAGIAGAIARHCPTATLTSIDGATHAMTTTHAAEVARLIAEHAARCGAAPA